jgi:hypothetical protein
VSLFQATTMAARGRPFRLLTNPIILVGFVFWGIVQAG